jgi:hypothetical protein
VRMEDRVDLQLDEKNEPEPAPTTPEPVQPVEEKKHRKVASK